MSEPTDHASPEHICNLAEDVLKLHKPDPDTPRTDAVTEDNKTYRITPKGVLSRVLNSNDCQKAADALELYIRRHNKAIFVEDNRLTFVDLEPV